MKAYVIKNKEGKYLDSCQDFETNNICDARLFDDYKEALSFSPKGCQVLEITIAQGDLEHQLAEKDKEIEELKFEQRNLSGLIEKVSSKGQQEIRHQVCEEIKKYLLKNWDWFKDLWLINGRCEELEQVLDQIEKGESDGQ